MLWYHAVWLYPLAFISTLPVFFTDVAGSLVEAIRTTHVEAHELHRRFALDVDAQQSSVCSSGSVYDSKRAE